MRVIGIDIGGTKCAISHLLENGSVEETCRIPTGGPAETLHLLSEAIERLGPGPDPRFGISCGSPLDGPKGLILSPPNLPGWDGIPICRQLTDRFGGRAFLINDANACALAEWRFGAGRGCQNMIFLTSGTGMGAGLILNGQLYEGTGRDAGEVGHMRLDASGPIGYGKIGSFEGFCSGGGIARLAELRMANRLVPAWARPPAVITGKLVTETAAGGDPFAMEIMYEVGQRFGQALAILIDLLNPERIVIGGYFPKCSHLLLPTIFDVLLKEVLPPSLEVCSIVPAELGETIGSYGAISAALNGAGIPIPATSTP